MKLLNKWYFVANTMHNFLKIQYTSLLPKYTKQISRRVFLHVFVFATAGV